MREQRGETNKVCEVGQGQVTKGFTTRVREA